MNKKSDYKMFIRRLVEDYGLTYKQAAGIADGLDDTELYECTEDRQGGCFGLERIQTELEWALTALEWSESGELGVDDLNAEETLKFFENTFSHNKMIPFIDEFWDVTIEEYEPE